MLYLEISKKSVPLQCVFHSIRFKVNKGWSTAVLLFLWPYAKYTPPKGNNYNSEASFYAVIFPYPAYSPISSQSYRSPILYAASYTNIFFKCLEMAGLCTPKSCDMCSCVSQTVSSDKTASTFTSPCGVVYKRKLGVRPLEKFLVTHVARINTGKDTLFISLSIK